MQRRLLMQLVVDQAGRPEPEEAPPAENQLVDSAALRILATWISQRSGLDPALGANIDRSFVVAQAHA